MGLRMFRRKPDQVYLVEWTGENLDEVAAWCPDGTFDLRQEGYKRPAGLWVRTKNDIGRCSHVWSSKETWELVRVGDFLEPRVDGGYIVVHERSMIKFSFDEEPD